MDTTNTDKPLKLPPPSEIDNVMVHRPWVIVSQPDDQKPEFVTVIAGPLGAEPVQFVHIMAIIAFNVAGAFHMPVAQLMEMVNERVSDYTVEPRKKH
jgi:hypothetical protein